MERSEVLFREWERCCDRIESIRDSLAALEKKQRKVQCVYEGARDDALSKIGELIIVRDAYRGALDD